MHGLLGGIASVEDLRIPARGFSGLGLRLLDTERRLWADYGVNGKGGAWDQITPRSCRWVQAVSRDGGRQWQENWVMHWTRA